MLGRNFHVNASIEFGTGFASFIEIAMLGCTSVHITIITCFVMKLLSVIKLLFNADLPGNGDMHFISDLRRPLDLTGIWWNLFPMFMHFCASVWCRTTLPAEMCSFLAQMTKWSLDLLFCYCCFYPLQAQPCGLKRWSLVQILAVSSLFHLFILFVNSSQHSCINALSGDWWEMPFLGVVWNPAKHDKVKIKMTVSPIQAALEFITAKNIVLSWVKKPKPLGEEESVTNKVNLMKHCSGVCQLWPLVFSTPAFSGALIAKLIKGWVSRNPGCCTGYEVMHLLLHFLSLYFLLGRMEC